MTPIFAQLLTQTSESGALATPYLEIAKLSSLPNPLESIDLELKMTAFVICLVGWIASIYTQRDNPSPELGTLVRVAIVVALIAFLGPIQKALTDIMYYFPRALITRGDGINSAGDQIRVELYKIMANEGANPSFFSLLKISLTQVVTTFIIIMLDAIALLGSVVLVALYFLQRFAVLLGFAGMPIALACFTLPAMRDKATNYILSVFSVMSWPFFLVIVNIAASYVFKIAGEDPLPSAWGVLGNVIAPAIAAIILIAGAFATPLFSYFLWTTGGGYLPPGTAGQVMNTAGSLGGIRRIFSVFSKGK